MSPGDDGDDEAAIDEELGALRAKRLLLPGAPTYLWQQKITEPPQRRIGIFSLKAPQDPHGPVLLPDFDPSNPGSSRKKPNIRASAGGRSNSR